MFGNASIYSRSLRHGGILLPRDGRVGWFGLHAIFFGPRCVNGRNVHFATGSREPAMGNRDALFGRTPWGRHILNLVNSSNGRLLSGRKIASAGMGEKEPMVFDVAISNNLVSAKVKGKSVPYYSVSTKWKPLSAKEKKLVLETIQGNLGLLSRVLNGQLPIELLSLLREKGIELLPTGIGDMEPSCDCPDATKKRVYKKSRALGRNEVCKHQAALLFQLVSEIDKNSMVMMDLRGLDVSSINFKNVSVMDMPFSLNPIASKGDTLKPKLPLVFNGLSDQSDFIIGALEPEPVFAPKTDFRASLASVYSFISKAGKNKFRLPKKWDVLLDKETDGTSVSESIERIFRTTSLHMEIGNDFSPKDARLVASNPLLVSFAPFNSLPGVEIVDHETVSMSLDTAAKLFSKFNDDSHGPSESYLFFHHMFRASVNLYVSSSYVPEIVPLPNHSKENLHPTWRVVYRPLMCTTQVKSMFDQLCSIYPICGTETSVRWAQGTSVFRNLDPVSGVDVGLAMILSLVAVRGALSSAACPVPKLPAHARKLGSVFFRDLEVFVPKTLQQVGIGTSAQRWLGVFDQLKQKVSAQLLLEEIPGTDMFSLKLFFDDEGELRSPQQYFCDGIQDPARRDALKFVSFLGTELLLNGSNPMDNMLTTGEFVLSQPEFEEFILSKVDTLQQLGIKVALPKALIKVYRPRVRINAHLSGKSSDSVGPAHRAHYIDKRAVLKFRVAIAIGKDVEISKEELLALVEDGRRLIKYRGAYVQLDPQQLSTLIAEYEQTGQKIASGKAPTEMDLVRAHFDDSNSGALYLEAAVEEMIADKFRAGDSSHVPETISATLRPYQVDGFRWMVSTLTAMKGCLLADDMGMGKTLQAICLLAHLKETGEISPDSPALVVAPASLLYNWESEINRFSMLVPYIYNGSQRVASTQDLRDKPDVVLTTYGTALKDFRKLAKNGHSTVVLDEAQYIKTHKAQTSKALKIIGENAVYRIALTGTPVGNCVSELHSLFEFFLPGWLGSLKGFSQAYIAPIEVWNSEYTVGNLQKLTKPFMLRRMKSQHLDELPEKNVQQVMVTLEKEQAAIYQAFVEQARKKDLNEGLETADILKLITNLKLVCNHPSLIAKSNPLSFEGLESMDDSFERTGKGKALFSIVKPVVDKGEKIVIFTQYARMAKLLVQMIKKEVLQEPLLLTGALSMNERDSVVKEFQENPSRQILVASLRTTGLGLNLTAANNVLFYDRWWNHSVESQAEDRVWRIGQDKGVMVYKFTCKGTVEEKIVEIIDKKKHITDMSVSPGESWMKDLDSHQLLDMVALSRDIV